MNKESLLKLKQDQEIKINDRIRHVFDTTPMLIDYWDRDHKIIDCNIYAMEFYGFETKEAYLRPDPLSLPDYQMNGEPSLQTRNGNLDIVFREGYGKFEFEERKLNGEIIHLETEGIRVKDAESGDYLVVTYSKDVTQFKDHKKLLNGLNRVAETLLTASEESRIDKLTEGVSIIGNLLGVDCAQIWNQKEINGELCLVVQYNWMSELFEYDKEGKIKEAIDHTYQYSKSPQWFNDTLLRGESINNPLDELPTDMMEFFKRYGVVSIAVLPMYIEGELIGFFAVHDCKNSRRFSKDEMDVLSSAGLMFTSVFNHNMQRELAYTDVLTGVRNRRYLLEEAENELQSCADTDFSLVIVDIDFFKAINDTYGHDIGDEVLQIFVGRVGSVLKKDTLFARYGGEEFVISLPSVAQEDAVKIAERIRKSIEATPFNTTKASIKVTGSFGVASRAGDGDTLFEIIKNADLALYEAKEAGRNVVYLHSHSQNSS